MKNPIRFHSTAASYLTEQRVDWRLFQADLAYTQTKKHNYYRYNVRLPGNNNE